MRKFVHIYVKCKCIFKIFCEDKNPDSIIFFLKLVYLLKKVQRNSNLHKSEGQLHFQYNVKNTFVTVRRFKK